MTSIQHVRDPMGAATVLESMTYTWDAMNNKTSGVHPLTVPPENRIYTYDAANRLTQSMLTTAGPPSLINYALDGAGNRQNVIGGPGAGPYVMNPALCEPADRQMNQYTTVAAISRQYDLNGNLISTSVPETFTYDYRNQLVRYIRLGLTTTYQYDALGRRISKNVA